MHKLIKQGFRFFGAGLFMFPVGIGVSTIGHEVIGLPEHLAAAIAFAVLLVLGFYLSRQFVFLSRGEIRHQAWRFAIAAVAARTSEYLIFLGLNIIIGLNYLVAFTGSLGISFLLKFVTYRKWVFNDGGTAPANRDL